MLDVNQTEKRTWSEMIPNTKLRSLSWLPSGVDSGCLWARNGQTRGNITVVDRSERENVDVHYLNEQAEVDGS